MLVTLGSEWVKDIKAQTETRVESFNKEYNFDVLFDTCKVLLSLSVSLSMASVFGQSERKFPTWEMMWLCKLDTHRKANSWSYTGISFLAKQTTCRV